MALNLTESAGQSFQEVDAGRNSQDSAREPTEGRIVRSRLRSLILRELPNPLRWIVAEILHFLDWIDRTGGAIARGMRESPAWYFMTTIGCLAVFLTFMMFLSVADQTSGRTSKNTAPVRAAANLSRQDMEALNEWAAQDHWRVAHFFVANQPRQRPKDIQLDSRLSAPPEPAAQPDMFGRSTKVSSTHGSNPKDVVDVRMDLSRPRIAQQGNRIAAGTVLDPGFLIADQNMTGRDHDLEGQTRAQAPQLLVQAAWEFGPDCNVREYVPTPPRRTKPVRVPLPEPEPEPEPITVPARQTAPDLAFEMVMTRHFSVEGAVPPGARMVETSDRSRFEIEEPASRSLASSEFNSAPWRESRPSSRRQGSSLRPYEGIDLFDPRVHQHPHADEYDENLRAVADVALRVELETPELAASGAPQRSRLHVTNEGQDQVSRLEVREFPDQLKTVVGASPDATAETMVDPVTGSRRQVLHRELPPLLPGEERDLTLDWVPEGPLSQTHRAQVIAHTEVSTLTRVTRPPAEQPMPSVPPEQVEYFPALECDVAHLDRIYMGEEIDLEIVVRNTGNTTLHQVKVAIEVPDQLAHRDGRRVIFEAGNLPVNARKQTVVRLAAIQAGEAVNRLHVNARERVDARGQTSLQVIERPKRDREREPVTQTRSTSEPAPPPPAKPRTLPLQKVEECCCQRVSMTIDLPNRIDSWLN